jgi:protein-S-isoprenylcysteine O-methyltransferase Ste14
MPLLALISLVAWFAIVSGVRGYAQHRRTGTAAIHLRDPLGSPQWWSRVVSSLGVAFAVAAPLAEITGLRPIQAIDQPVARFGGVVMMVMGVTYSVAAQLSMGASWRADVDPDARTELVTSGPFRFVRNPILSGTAITSVGYALLVGNVLAVLMLVAFVVSMQIQVRLVEEPYLTRVHGDRYRRYAAGTGRFVPGIGRLRSPEDGARD